MTKGRPAQPVVRENKNGRVYVIGLPAGVARPGGFGTRFEARAWLAAQADALAAAQQIEVDALGGRIRPCMCCQENFRSEGPHNRLCNSCRNRASHEAEPSVFSFGRANGRRK